MKPRVALCLVGEPRGIKSCIGSLYEFVVDPLEATIFYSFNRATPQDEEKIALINRNVAFGELKEKPDLRKALVPDSLYNKLQREDFYFQSNWVGTVNGQTGGVCYRHVDFKRMAEIISDKVRDFDYFIVTRTDFRYLFPIFDFSMLKYHDIIKHKGFDNEKKTGMNWEFIIWRAEVVLEYLNSPFTFMNDENLQNLLIGEFNQRPRNNESMQRVIAKFYEWHSAEMEINGFISADSFEEKTTWGHVEQCGRTGLFFKYRDMYCTALENQEKFQANPKWKLENNSITIG
jgi:hypothetical protein